MQIEPLLRMHPHAIGLMLQSAIDECRDRPIRIDPMNRSIGDWQSAMIAVRAG
jgi:hypothetical protein